MTTKQSPTNAERDETIRKFLTLDTSAPIPTVFSLVADGHRPEIVETQTRYGSEYVVVAGSSRQRTLQMIELPLVFLSREDAQLWIANNIVEPASCRGCGADLIGDESCIERECR